MKKVIYSIAAVTAAASMCFTAQAGPVSQEYKQVVEEIEVTSCFAANELSLDVFGAYQWSDEYYSDGFGGGVGVNYFFTDMIGVGAEYMLSDTQEDVSGIHTGSASLIVRIPIDDICLAPYAMLGGSGIVNGETNYGLFAGGGVEWRATDDLGVFTDARYTWVEDDYDTVTVRAGLRFIF